LSDPACQRCPLHKTATRVCIPGRGDDRPEVIFVGQAPGEQEDQEGRCFVGPAGQLLRQAISKYIKVPYRLTNAVKCFPPDDRDPKKNELHACSIYLDAEIDQCRPKVIVAVGNVALKALSGKSGITTYSGKVVSQVGYPTGPGGADVFALLHPSFILRYPRNVHRFEADFRALADLLSPGVSRKPGPVPRRMSPGELEVWLRGHDPSVPLAFDFETNGRAKRDGGRIRSVSFSDGFNDEAVWIDVDLYGAEAMAVVAVFLKSKVPKVAHNKIFETNWCVDEFGFEPRALTWDTLLLHYIKDENAAHNLESVAMQVCQAPAWDIHLQMKENTWTWDTVPMDVLGPYNALDSYWTARIRQPLWDRLGPRLRDLYTKIVLPQAKVCARMERRGVFIDGAWATKAAVAYGQKADSLYARLLEEGAVQRLAEELKKKKLKLNLNSSKQVARLLFGILGLEAVEVTKGGQPSTKDSALERIKEGHPILALFMEWKKACTVITRYLKKFPLFRTEEGLVHASFNPARIVTGRIAVTDPPMQTLPTGKVVRGIIASRWKDHGGKIITADYSQLEVRLVASEANETGLIAALKAGDDPHTRTARLVFGSEFHDKDHCDRCTELRSIAKRINFGVVYGISPKSLASEFNLTMERAEYIFKQYWRKHPNILKWMRWQHAHLREKGWVRSMFGRVRRLPEIRTADERLAARLMRQAGNFPIQSGGADLTNMAMSKIDRWLVKNKMQSLLILQIHDSIMIDAHPDEVDVVKGKIVELMCDEVQGECPWLRVPLKADVKVEDRWGGAKEVKLGA
jgi:DNA polymerase-1